MTDNIPEALAVLDELNLRLLNVVEHTTNNLFAEGMTREIVKLQKARAAFSDLYESTDEVKRTGEGMFRMKKALAAVENLP